MVGEIFCDGECGDSKDLFFAHDAHGFVTELIGVVDGFDSGAGGVECAWFARGVDRYAVAGAGAFADRCG